LTKLCKNDSRHSLLRNLAWTMSNLCRGKPQPVFSQVEPLLNSLGDFLYSNDSEVLTDACWALSYMSDGSNNQIQAVIRAGVVRRVVELMMHESNQVKTPALRTIGNIVTGDEMQTQIALNCGAVDALFLLLGNDRSRSRKEACWTLSNITAGNTDQIQLVIEANCFPRLIEILRTDAFDVKKEACWAIANAVGGGKPSQLSYFVGLDILGSLFDILSCADDKIVMVALEAIENIVRAGSNDLHEQRSGTFVPVLEELLEQLENLKDHPDTAIADKSLVVLCESRKAIDTYNAWKKRAVYTAISDEIPTRMLELQLMHDINAYSFPKSHTSVSSIPYYSGNGAIL